MTRSNRCPSPRRTPNWAAAGSGPPDSPAAEAFGSAAAAIKGLRPPVAGPVREAVVRILCRSVQGLFDGI